MMVYRANMPTPQELAERCREMAGRVKSPARKAQLMVLAAEYDTKAVEADREGCRPPQG
jgi:hypothetical protein